MYVAVKNSIRSLLFVLLILNIVSFRTQDIAAAVQLKNPSSISITNIYDEADLQTTWDCIWLGHYPQSSGSSNEPIKWRVLSTDGKEAFLVSDIILDRERYNVRRDVVTWETCDLRSWLNNDFLNRAFNEKEKAAIKTVRIANNNNPKYSEWSSGNDTVDKIFLLSYDELTNKAFGFPEAPEIQSATRAAVTSAYARALGVSARSLKSSVEYGQYWMRTIGYDPNYASHIYWEGWVYGYGWYVDSDCYGVRPALYMDLSSSAWSYAGTVCSDGTVKGPEEAKEPDTKDPEQADDSTSKDSSSESKSKTYIVGAFSYTVTNNTATIAVPKTKTAKTVTIPATVKVNGKSVPVTSIASNAFKGMKNLTSVTIGKNVKKIGKNAFNGCKKLKKITIKTMKLTKSSVGANAFKGINKKAVIKCPKAKKAAYKKFLLKKGMKKTMTFK